MNYLRKYNESSYSELVSGINDIAEQSLSYLLDKGYEYEINSGNYEKSLETISFRIMKTNPTFGVGDNRFNFINWNDINDDFMQFVELLSLKYDVKFISFRVNREFFITTRVNMEIEEFLNSNIEDTLEEYRNGYISKNNNLIGYISMRVGLKKNQYKIPFEDK